MRHATLWSVTNKQTRLLLPERDYTLRSGLCCRNSVCLSVCRLSAVTLVHPTQGVEAFSNISSPLCTLPIH